MNSYKQRHVAERNLGDLGQWQRFHPLLCGGSGSASVTANATDAQWTAHSNVNWVTITSGASGTGSGTVAYVVAADSTGAQRVGTVTIAGQTFTVTQPPVSLPNWLITNVPGAANGCPVPAGISTFAPTDAQAVVWFQVSGAQAGDVARVNWIAPNGSIYRTISWNPILSAGSWCMADSMNIVGTAAASMPGQWTASVTWNNYPLFALNFTIGSCSYSLAAAGVAAPASGANSSVSVTATPGSCSWAATSNASWLTITAGATVVGNGTVSFSVAANTGTQRVGTLTIAGQTFTVNQSAAVLTCTFSLSSTSTTYPASGGTGSVSFTASDPSCTWAASSNSPWVTITSGANGSGSGTVSYTVASYVGTSPRTAVLTIAG